MRTLPNGVSEADFARALKDFEAAVGHAWVFSAPDDVALYRDAYSVYWGEKQERVAAAAVAPIKVEEIQAVVRIANKYKIPLFAISTGKNLTYGGSAPNLSGSVIVDLKRMNRIIEVDDKRHFCVVEPGVSYFDMYRHIEDKHLKLWIDCADPGWGSLVGNSLDHGIGHTYGPYRDHFGSHCGMEVVLGNGDIMRTGMGALPGSQSGAEFKYGYGPSVDGLFAQGNFGIVTKMGFWMLPQPEAVLQASVMAPRYEDLAALIHEVSYLEDLGLIGEPGYGSPLSGFFFAPPPPDLAVLMANGWPSEDALNAYAQAKKKPCWQANLTFYGPPETVMAGWAAAQRRVSALIPGAFFRDQGVLTIPLSAEAKAKVRLTQFGIPNMEVYSLVTRNEINAADPPVGHTDFTCVIPRTAESVIAAQKAFYQAFIDMGMTPQTSPFSAPVCWLHRCFIMPATIWTYQDPERNKKARDLFNHLIDVATRNGWAEYRTSPAFQDKLSDQYSFGNHALRRFTERLKDAADPNGILAPGRGGVWPKRFRSAEKVDRS